MISIPKTIAMRFDSNLHSGSVSPEGGSAASWEQSFMHLSASLNSICGGTRPRHLSASADARCQTARQVSFSPVRSLSNELVPSDNTVEVPAPITHAQAQRVRVKHEESEANLELRLADICKTRAAAAVAAVASRTESNGFKPMSSASSVEQPAPSASYRVSVDIDSRPVEDIVVSVTGNTVCVRAMTDRPGVVCEQEIPENVDVERLMCCAHTCGTFVVSEYARQIVHPSRTRSSVIYCPILSCSGNAHAPDGYDVNEQSQFLLIIHIAPEHIRCGICIKTVDDHLIVSERHATSPDTGSVCSGSGPTICIIALPDFVNTRSVAAVLTEQNQLVITASANDFRSRSHTF